MPDMPRRNLKLAILFLAIHGVSCTPAPDAARPTAATKSSEPVDTRPSQVEIGEAQLTWHNANELKVQIPYKFTQGSPRKVYEWSIRFPGTEERGFRPTEAWELKVEGVQKTGFVLGTNSLESFEIELFEAESPQSEYKKISNTAKGAVPKYEAAPSSTQPPK